jgi:hypothetical protein
LVESVEEGDSARSQIGFRSYSILGCPLEIPSVLVGYVVGNKILASTEETTSHAKPTYYINSKNVVTSFLFVEEITVGY